MFQIYINEESKNRASLELAYQVYKDVQKSKSEYEEDIKNAHGVSSSWGGISCCLRARAHWPLCLATGGRVFVAGIFIPVGNHYFQALVSTLQFVAQVCDRLWLVPATDRAFAYITYMSP